MGRLRRMRDAGLALPARHQRSWPMETGSSSPSPGVCTQRARTRRWSGSVARRQLSMRPSAGRPWGSRLRRCHSRLGSGRQSRRSVQVPYSTLQRLAQEQCRTSSSTVRRCTAPVQYRKSTSPLLAHFHPVRYVTRAVPAEHHQRISEGTVCSISALRNRVQFKLQGQRYNPTMCGVGTRSVRS